jgi:hypothetical protein
MATAELYLVPMPVTAPADHRPPANSQHLPPAVWTAAMGQLLLVDAGDHPLFDGRFQDAHLEQQGQEVAVDDIADSVRSAVAEYRTRSAAAGPEFEVGVGAWSFYYRYLDGYTAYVVAHYSLTRTTQTGNGAWYLQVAGDAGATHTFLVTAVARVTIPKTP